MKIPIYISHTLNLPNPWQVFTIGLNRGEPDYRSINEKPEYIAMQWRLFTLYLNYLSSYGYLYAIGRFCTQCKCEVMYLQESNKEDSVGAIKLSTSEEIINLMIENPLEWYVFFVVESQLNLQVLKLLVETPYNKNIFENIIEHCENVFCMVQENNDRDFFDLALKQDNSVLLLDKFKIYARTFDFEICN